MRTHLGYHTAATIQPYCRYWHLGDPIFYNVKAWNQEPNPCPACRQALEARHARLSQ